MNITDTAVSKKWGFTGPLGNASPLTAGLRRLYNVPVYNCSVGNVTLLQLYRLYWDVFVIRVSFSVFGFVICIRYNDHLFVIFDF